MLQTLTISQFVRFRFNHHLIPLPARRSRSHQIPARGLSFQYTAPPSAPASLEISLSLSAQLYPQAPGTRFSSHMSQKHCPTHSHTHKRKREKKNFFLNAQLHPSPSRSRSNRLPIFPIITHPIISITLYPLPAVPSVRPSVRQNII